MSTSEETMKTEEQETQDPVHREAAKYRRQLREVEAERDQLTEQVTLLKSAQLNMALSREMNGLKLVDPNYFELAGIEQESLYKETGELDLDKLQETLSSLQRERKELFAPLGQRPDPSVSKTPPHSSYQGSFNSAFAPKQ